MARKPGKTPTYAKNQTELGGYLQPPRDRKIIQQALKMEGNPGRTLDGRYHIQEWQGFIHANFQSLLDPSAGGGDDKRNLEMEKLRLQNAKLQFELQIKQKDYSANADIEQWVGQMVMEAKRALLAIPSKLAPVVIGLDEVGAEKRMHEEINLALEKLTQRPLSQ